MINLILILLLLVGCENPAQQDDCDSNSEYYSLCEDSISFMLKDLNSTSPTYCSQVGPDSWTNEIRLFYFSTSET